MNVLQIVLTICIIGMFIISLALIRLIFQKSNKLIAKKSIKPSLIDKMLFYERNPFAWRIGFAYSLLGYNQEEIEKFNAALYKIIMVEKNMYHMIPGDNFKHIISRVKHDEDTVEQIKKYSNLLSSNSILNESDPEDLLSYILSQEIDEFIRETAQSIRQDKIDRMELPPEEPPF